MNVCNEESQVQKGVTFAYKISKKNYEKTNVAPFKSRKLMKNTFFI